MYRWPKWSVLAAVAFTSATAFAIGAVVSDPTLCPVYTSPTMPGVFLYPDPGCAGTPVLILPDGGRIPLPPDGGAKPPPPKTPANPNA